ncbi:MAG: UDP-N-acetylglucosamine 2-epimerase [Candidatus Micrarchaeota archaeon]
MRKIFFVIGTRAEAIKILPVIKELEKRKHSYVVVSSGQHDLREFKFKNFIELNPATAKSGGFKSAFEASFFLLKAMPRLIMLLRKEKSVVIVHGDTMTTTAGALAGRLAGCIVCHLESGLRTHDLRQPFPEEASRVIADFLSQVHFASTKRAFKVTHHSSTFLVGNTVIDSIKQKHLRVSDKKFVLVSVHRQENINDCATMQKIVAKVLEISKKHKVKWIMHGNTVRKLCEYELMHSIRSKCEVIDLMPYEKFLPLLAQSTAVLSDSGGLAEECAFLRKPLVILREKTERMESVDHGYALLGFNFDFEEFLKKFSPDAKDIYGDGTTGIQVVSILERISK